MRILLIDDSETSARFLKALLTKASRGALPFEVDRAESLFAALRRIDGGPPIDAILLDLGLPECGGLTTLKLVRAHAPTIPIVVVTGLDSAELATEARDAGAAAYLVKGQFGGRAVEQALVEAAGRHEATPTAPELRGTFRAPGPG